MAIVLNEYGWARDMIASRDLGKKPYETLCRVARYYSDIYHYSKKETRKMLDKFLIECEPTASLPKWSDTMDYAVANALKRKAVDIDFVPVTKAELDIIDGLDGKPLRRLAFTLLCLAKYWNVVNPDSGYWVNTKDSEIMKMANISTSIKRQSELYHILYEKGLIRFSKKVDNTNVQVCFVKAGAPALKVTDFRNLGWQYLKYLGEPYFVCENCGITVKYNDPKGGRQQKYCKDCAVKIKTQQNVNAVMRHRRYG